MKSSLCLASLAVLFGCTTPVLVRTDPHRATVTLNDELIAERTPVKIELDRRAFAWGTDSLQVTAAGFRPLEAELSQTMDDDCVSTATVFFLVGLPAVLPALGAALSMPWCTVASEPEIFLELEELDAPADPEGRT